MHQVVPALEVVIGERDRQDGPWLLLENGAGHEGTIGVTISELAPIIDELGRPDGVGICLDTCHLFASGIEITTLEGMDELLTTSTRRSGSTGSAASTSTIPRCPLARSRDRHENLAKGEIGEGLAVMVGHPALQHLPMVMETPGADGHGVDLTEMASLRRLNRKGVKRWQTVASSR